MKKKLHLLPLLLLTVIAFAQNTENVRVGYAYETAENLMRSKNYAAALESLQKNAGTALHRSDSLLYLKIKILENLYAGNAVHTQDLDTTLRLFLRRVNRYSFPEMQYAEVGRINTRFQDFKESDKNFYDSVTAVTHLDKPETLPAIHNRLTDYLRSTPNSFYNKQLTDLAKRVESELNRLARLQQKRINDSLNRAALKRMGKGTVLNLSYAVPTNTLGDPFRGLHGYADAEKFFTGTYSGGLGLKYALNASLFNAFINLHTANRWKVSIDWNIFNAEYDVLDWAADTLLRKEAAIGFSSKKASELRSVKAGTRIGPTVTVLLTRKIAASVYYSARPGVQFLLGDYYFADYSDTATYSVKPVINNYNLAHEIGIKFRFIKTLYVNPYLHLGEYTWQSKMRNDKDGSTQTLKAAYPFRFVGLRLGF